MRQPSRRLVPEARARRQGRTSPAARVVDPNENETRAIRALVDFTGKAVIEIGAGDGRMTWRYADSAARVLALDPREDDVHDAIRATPQKRRRSVRFVVADATTYRYPRRRFDVAVLSYSLC